MTALTDKERAALRAAWEAAVAANAGPPLVALPDRAGEAARRFYDQLAQTALGPGDPDADG